MSLSNLDDLVASWGVFLEDRNPRGKLTQAGAWRRDNPVEWEKLQAYRAGGPRPDLATQFGRIMVEETDAWYEAIAGPILCEPPEPPPPPPPEPETPPIFDGRAKLMSTLRGSTVRVGDPEWQGGSDASQSPIIWGDPPFTVPQQGVYIMGDDGRLIDDPDLGRAYRFEIGQGSTNPYLDLNASGRASGELTRLRPMVMGSMDWYSDSFRIEPGYVMPPKSPYNVICQYGYPSLASPPLSICFDTRGLGIDRHVGVLQAVGDLTGALIEKPRVYPLSSVIGNVVDTVIGVRWAMDNTGEVYFLARCRALGETELVEKWSHRGTVTFQQIKGQSIKSKANDKMGLYFGSFPVGAIATNRVTHSGFRRYATREEAVASLP